MTHSWKPDGYSSLSPYVAARGAQRVIDVLATTFDAKPLHRFDMPDGTIIWWISTQLS